MSFIKLYRRAKKVTKLFKLLYSVNAEFDTEAANAFLNSKVRGLDDLTWAETKRLSLLLNTTAAQKYSVEYQEVVAGNQQA